jgi:hypothetical protein
MAWQAQQSGEVYTSADMPSKAEARAGLAMVIALDEAGAFGD